jgi:putative hydrolase of the HAD superfamily
MPGDNLFIQKNSKHCAVLWDVYGTILAAQRGDLDSLIRREAELRAAFAQTIRHFHLDLDPAALHRDFLETIAAHRAAKLTDGIPHPEIRIEHVWQQLTPAAPARDIALYFERHANPKQLMPGARETLRAIRDRGLRQGIVSNAQFYTPIELEEMLGPGLFDPDLTFFSFDLGIAKPDPTAFQRAAAVLAREGISTAECLMVGDSFTNDIEASRALGFDAIWFAPTGDIQQLPQLLERL